MRIEQIGLKRDAFGREVRHQHAGDVLQGLHVVHTQDALIVADDVILVDGLEVVALRELSRRPERDDVRLDGAGLVVQDVPIQEIDGFPVRHDRRADVKIGPQSSDVIEVRDEN